IGGSRNVAEWLQGGASGNFGDVYMDGNPLDRNILASLMVLGLIVLISRRERTLAVLKANAPIICYVSYCVFSLMWSPYPLVGLRRWFRLVGDIIMVLVLLTELDVTAAVRRVFTRGAFVLLPISVLLIRYYPDMGRSYGLDGSVFWTGVATG